MRSPISLGLCPEKASEGQALALSLIFDYNMQVYNADMLPDIALGDLVHLRKPHPCGGSDFKVVRLGADIGLECLTCSHRVLLTRRKLARRMKTLTPKAQDDPK